MQELTVTNQDAAERILAWIEAQAGSGVRLFVIDGPLGSGKTTLARNIEQLAPYVRRISLDDYIKPPISEPTWLEAARQSDALWTWGHAIADDRLTLVEGPCASALVAEVPQANGVLVRRIFLKRVTAPNGEHIWDDDPDTAAPREDRYLQSIQDHHQATKPWLAADLVVARIDDQ